MIEINIQKFDDGLFFITDFTLPNGEQVTRDIENPESVGFEKLIGFDGQKAIMKYSDGRHRVGYISDISEDEFLFTDEKDVIGIGV